MKETNNLQVEENQKNRILEIISKPESIDDLCLDMDLDQIRDFYIKVENLSEQLSTSRYRMEEIGKKLLDFIEDYARKKGIKKVRFDSTEYARPFYLKSGYKLIKKKVGKLGIPNYEMEKNLK